MAKKIVVKVVGGPFNGFFLDLGMLSCGMLAAGSSHTASHFEPSVMEDEVAKTELKEMAVSGGATDVEFVEYDPEAEFDGVALVSIGLGPMDCHTPRRVDGSCDSCDVGMPHGPRVDPSLN